MGSCCITEGAHYDTLWQHSGVGVGWEVQEEVNICILMADSHCCMAEQHFCKAIKLQLKVHFLKNVENKCFELVWLSSLKKVDIIMGWYTWKTRKSQIKSIPKSHKKREKKVSYKIK